MTDYSSTKDVPIITNLRTNDVEELAEFVRGWNQEHIQLKKGAFEWKITIIQIGEFQFIEEFYGAPALLRGSTPPGTFTIAIPQIYESENLYGGNSLIPGCYITGNCDGYLDFRVGNQNRLFMMVAPINQILEQAEKMSCNITQKQLLSPGVIFCELNRLNPLSNYLEELLRLAKVYPQNLRVNSQSYSMVDLIIDNSLSLLVNLLTSDSNFLPDKESNRRQLVKNAEILIRDHFDLPITLTSLCQELKTSQRSLYYAFEECLGLSPMQYFKILRLNKVRRALKSADPKISKVTKIAGGYGFWHMGQFSIDYRKMFGESPSITLKKDIKRQYKAEF
ncbi:MAG: helix-turn-helix domain-containing protein [Xenococcaceae cyanobacterium MO_167.B52]|nr:helix-turn-helix domain-containing protein [Xenococcaceae cyanobacterium MO_167.B52]